MKAAEVQGAHRQRTIVLRSLWSDKCIRLSASAASLDSKR